jgi:hypothetical protein
MRVLQGPTLPGLSTTSSSFRHRNISYYYILVCFIIPDRPTYCSASNRRRQDVSWEVRDNSSYWSIFSQDVGRNVTHHFQKWIACMIAYEAVPNAPAWLSASRSMSSLSVQISSSIGFAGWWSILQRSRVPSLTKEPSAWSDTKYKLSSEHALWPRNTEPMPGARYFQTTAAFCAYLLLWWGIKLKLQLRCKF